MKKIFVIFSLILSSWQIGISHIADTSDIVCIFRNMSYNPSKAIITSNGSAILTTKGITFHTNRFSYVKREKYISYKEIAAIKYQFMTVKVLLVDGSKCTFSSYRNKKFMKKVLSQTPQLTKKTKRLYTK